MRRLLAIFSFCCLLIIITFLLFGDIEGWIELNLGSDQSKFTYTLLSFAFLASDLVLPVPSSLVMVLNGKVLGPLFGTLLSLLSGLVSSSVGFYLGRKTNPYLNKLFSQRDREISNNLFNRFGNTAIAISKALPIVSEAISLVSGTTSISFRTFLVYSFAGHFAVSLIYAYAGSYLNYSDSSIITAVIIVSALLISWILQLLLNKTSAKKETAKTSVLH